MEKFYLKSILENEERVNKIIEVLACSSASHFKVSYDSYEIELTAFADEKDDAQQVANLMRVFSSSTDKLEMKELENVDGKFWVISLTIPIKED